MYSSNMATAVKQGQHGESKGGRQPGDGSEIKPQAKAVGLKQHGGVVGIR